jgi:glycosyltransferase involved in cell wall biosynthesis
MNIVFLLRYWPILGGGETVTRLLANKFTELGRKVSVIYLWETKYVDMPFIDNRIQQLGIKGVSVPGKNYAINKFDFNLLKNSLYDYIMNNKADIIINQWWSAKLVFKAIKKTDTRLICCHHTTIRNHPIIRTLKQRIFYTIFKTNDVYIRMFRAKNRLRDKFKYSDRLVMLSNTFTADCKQLFNKNNDKIRTIPNPLTFNEFISQENILKKQKELLYVGRIDENKRLHYIIKAWKELQIKEKCTDWKLTIVGDGSELENVKEYAKQIDCINVYFAGYQNPIDYYKRASVLVMTSANEGFPMVLVEAQQNGCVPVVMDSFQALHDIIQDDTNGLIVKNDDIDDLVLKLAELMSDDEHRLKLALKGLETCKVFSIDTVIQQWEALFKELSND